MVKCRDSRKKLYLSKSAEVVSENLAEASRHVQECRECGEFIRGERHFSSLLKGAFRKDEIPQELKERVLGETKEEKITRKRIFQGTVIAASILILLTLSVTLGRFIFNGQNPAIVSDIVDDHIQFFQPSDMQVQSSIPEEIRPWFTGKVDFPLHIPHLAAKLKGGRLCFLGKKRVALLFYEHQGSPVSLFVTRDLDIQRLKTEKKVMLKGKGVYPFEERGYHLLVWEEEGLNYILVSELSINELQVLI